MDDKELYREIKSGAFSMQVADCDRNIRIQFEKLQQENQELKKDIKNIIRIVNNNCDELVTTEEEFESLKRWNK